MRWFFAFYFLNSAMKRIIFCFICFTFWIPGFSQITVNVKHIDLGSISENGIRYADFIFTNKGNKKDYILRINNPREYSILIKNKTLLPDSSTFLRIQYNPRQTGKFAEEIDVYVSSALEPIKISLAGEIIEMPKDASPACPDFSNSTSKAEQISFPLKIEVIDYYSRKPIPRAIVRITSHGQDFETIKVNSQGKAIRKIPLGYYYFITSAENYISEEFDTFVNKKVDCILIELEQKENILVENPVIIDKDTEEIIVWIPEKKDTIVLNEKPVTVISQSDSSITIVEINDSLIDDFSTKDYLPNNIVYLVDVSGSMVSKGKLNILKAAMIKMAEKLRSCDRISLVAYNSKAEVIIPSLTGDNQEEIIQKIKNLQGGGTTSGEAGLIAAYDVANDNLIAGGNNQVIMVTDGIFDLKGQNILKIVKKNNKAGIITSVVGVKTDSKSEDNLKQISETGKGNLISLQTYEQAELKLLEELKAQSKISK
jgi:Ca-activated chloride channel family protein